jgi:hypothetical protein
MLTARQFMKISSRTIQAITLQNYCAALRRLREGR